MWLGGNCPCNCLGFHKEGKRTEQNSTEGSFPLLTLKEMCTSPVCKTWLLPAVEVRREAGQTGTPGMGHGGAGPCFGLSLPQGQPAPAAACVRRRQSSLWEAGPSLITDGWAERMGSKERMSACEDGAPKSSCWQQSSWPLLLVQIGWPRRILITAQLLSP